MKTFKQFLEMTINLGDKDLNLSTEKLRKNSYADSKNYPIIKNISNTVNLHKLNDGDTEKYITNDHDLKQSIHKSEFLHHNKNTQFPFNHHEQIRVEKIKTSKLPVNYAQDVVYDHFLKSKSPLITSTYQTPKGHKMWRKLAHRTLSDGCHVYYHDGKDLHKTTEDNIENHLDSYFDPGTIFDHNNKIINPMDYEHKHIILSKKKL